MQHQLDSLDKNSTDYLENDNRLKKGPELVVRAAERLLELCSSSDVYKVEKLPFTFQQEMFELNSFSEQASRFADGKWIAVGMLQQNFLKGPI